MGNDTRDCSRTDVETADLLDHGLRMQKSQGGVPAWVFLTDAGVSEELALRVLCGGSTARATRHSIDAYGNFAQR